MSPLPLGLFDDLNFLKHFARDMIRARVLEEQLIGLWKKGQGFFWTGGPGEEALNISIARLLKKGRGPCFDYFHPHYRNGTVSLGLGAPMSAFIRQMRCSANDPYSGGRNFVSHTAIPDWNIIPVSSPVATQCLLALGTARAQARQKSGAISVSVIGEASSGSPDFASALVWASRPGEELPLLLIVSNNGVGITTKSREQLSAISTRAKAFGLRHENADGVNPEKTWQTVKSAFDYVRKEQRPMVLELKVSRLYGHSSSSGANLNEAERCPLAKLSQLAKKKEIALDVETIRRDALEEFQTALKDCAQDSWPAASTVLNHSFAGPTPPRLPL